MPKFLRQLSELSRHADVNQSSIVVFDRRTRTFLYIVTMPTVDWAGVNPLEHFGHTPCDQKTAACEAAAGDARVYGCCSHDTHRIIKDSIFARTACMDMSVSVHDVDLQAAAT